MRRYECEFETVEAEAQGCSLFGGAGIVTQAHREVIRRRGADGWRLTACIPARQRGEGFVEAWDLIFERGSTPGTSRSTRGWTTRATRGP